MSSARPSALCAPAAPRPSLRPASATAARPSSIAPSMSQSTRQRMRERRLNNSIVTAGSASASARPASIAARASSISEIAQCERARMTASVASGRIVVEEVERFAVAAGAAQRLGGRASRVGIGRCRVLGHEPQRFRARPDGDRALGRARRGSNAPRRVRPPPRGASRAPPCRPWRRPAPCGSAGGSRRRPRRSRRTRSGRGAGGSDRRPRSSAAPAAPTRSRRSESIATGAPASATRASSTRASASISATATARRGLRIHAARAPARQQMQRHRVARGGADVLLDVGARARPVATRARARRPRTRRAGRPPSTRRAPRWSPRAPPRHPSRPVRSR